MAAVPEVAIWLVCVMPGFRDTVLTETSHSANQPYGRLYGTIYGTINLTIHHYGGGLRPKAAPTVVDSIMVDGEIYGAIYGTM